MNTNEDQKADGERLTDAELTALSLARVLTLAEQWASECDVPEPGVFNPGAKYRRECGRLVREAIEGGATAENWFREEYERAKVRNAQIPRHAQMVVTNPALSTHRGDRRDHTAGPISSHHDTAGGGSDE